MGWFSWLGGDRYYHGTRSSIGSGGRLRPGGMFNDNWGFGGQDDVFITTDPNVARWYAEGARGFGRARVYEVEPEGFVSFDDSEIEDEAQTTSWRTRSAKVRREL